MNARTPGYRLWDGGGGSEGGGVEIDPSSIAQMEAAIRLPVAAAGALMPDAHVGYGLPIGGVLATRGSVIPYAVGVDIACRVCLSVTDLPVAQLSKEHERMRLGRAIERETRFGIGSKFDKTRQHDVMDEDWDVSPVTRKNRDKAWSQLGTSGSGNHFVEWGRLMVEGGGGKDLGLEDGSYVALLSHSGSRGTGASVCQHYSGIAMRKRRADLDPKYRHLSWLSLDEEEGREYWAAMNLMGAYAHANHEMIHRHVLRAAGARAIAVVENHHNFAWRETHLIDGAEEEVVVHRKGATPAGAGVLGVIPGSMAQPGFIVRGKGSPPSLNSAAHGAGRLMSRTKAKQMFRWAHVRPSLDAAGVTLLSAGIDECPGVYKDIHAVMTAQDDLVEAIARFDPSIVKMAPDGERAED